MNPKLSIFFYSVILVLLTSCSHIEKNKSASSSAVQTRGSVKVSIISTSDSKVVYGELAILLLAQLYFMKARSLFPNTVL